MGKNIINHYVNVIKSVYRDVGIPNKRSHLWPRLEKKFLLNNPQCAFCGSIKKLHVHHKKPFHLYPELELDENNLITLCMDTNECHLKIGHGNNFKYYFLEIDSLLIELRKNNISLDDVIAISREKRLFTRSDNSDI